MDKPQSLNTTDGFVTLNFFRVTTPTTSKHFKPEFRTDILINQLTDQTEKYVSKIKQVLGNPKILESFERQVKQANKPMLEKVIMSARSKGVSEAVVSLGRWLVGFSMFGIGTLGLYWEKVKLIFGDVNYDSQIISAQVTAVLSLLAILISTRRQ